MLSIIVATDVKHAREQADQYGCDFSGPYHDSEFGRVLKLLKGDGHTARIAMPFVTFRKMVYNGALWDLLDRFGQPELILMCDEVHEMYTATNGRLPKAVDALRTKYERCT